MSVGPINRTLSVCPWSPCSAWIKCWAIADAMIRVPLSCSITNASSSLLMSFGLQNLFWKNAISVVSFPFRSVVSDISDELVFGYYFRGKL